MGYAVKLQNSGVTYKAMCQAVNTNNHFQLLSQNLIDTSELLTKYVQHGYGWKNLSIPNIGTMTAYIYSDNYLRITPIINCTAHVFKLGGFMTDENRCTYQKVNLPANQEYNLDGQISPYTTFLLNVIFE